MGHVHSEDGDAFAEAGGGVLVGGCNRGGAEGAVGIAEGVRGNWVLGAGAGG
jgi:hypothetical protein